MRASLSLSALSVSPGRLLWLSQNILVVRSADSCNYGPVCAQHCEREREREPRPRHILALSPAAKCCQNTHWACECATSSTVDQKISPRLGQPTHWPYPTGRGRRARPADVPPRTPQLSDRSDISIARNTFAFCIDTQPVDRGASPFSWPKINCTWP